MSSAEAAQAMSKEIQLSLGPDAGPNDDSTQVGEAARAREPRSRYRPDGSRRRTQGELQQRRKAKQKGAGFWATPQARRLTGSREGEPAQNRSQTWQDRNGVWHNWRTSETASESASTRTRNAQQTWNQKGQDWQRDRPSSSQDWRHDWKWEGDRDRTPRPLLHRIQLVGASRRGQTMSRGARAAIRCGTKMNAGRQAVFSGASPGEPGKPSGPCTQKCPWLWRSHRGRLPRQESGPQPKRKVVEKWSLFEALTKKLGGRHRPFQRLPWTRRFQKIPHQLPYRPGTQSGAELWQLDAELLGLFFDGTQWNPSCQNGRNSSA